MTTFHPCEDECTEFKRELTGTLGKEVVAFLNSAKGGDIYIGVEDDEKPSEKTLDNFGKISERIREEFGSNVAQAFEIIYEHPRFSAEEVAAELSKTSRTAENYIAKLKQGGVIIRKGPKLGGHWEVIE